MRVFVTGASGLVGVAALRGLQRNGHTAIGAPRTQRDGAGRRTLTSATEYARLMAGCEAVINLAGESVLARRWTPAYRQALRDSRVGVTQSLVAAIARAQPRPRLLISASAVGYYGDRGSQPLAETADAGADFLARLCCDWEAAARGAEALGVRVVCLRIGVVLARDGGALRQMRLPFRLGLGGPIGDGSQYFPWVHRRDLVGIMLAALDDARYQGAINAVAPEAVTNRQFARALGRALHRPAVLPLPAWALRLRYGDASDPLLASLNVVPQRLLDLQFPFRYPALAPALADATAARP